MGQLAGGVQFGLPVGLMLGPELYMAPSALAQRADKSQLKAAADNMMVCARLRVGYRRTVHGGTGVMLSLEPGVDAMPITDTFKGSGSVWRPTLSGSITPFLQLRAMRIYGGAFFSLQPSMTRSAAVTYDTFLGTDSGPRFFDYAPAGGVVLGARVRIDRNQSLGAFVSVGYGVYGWAPVIGLSWSFDFERAPAVLDPEDPPEQPLNGL
jgi:hypothetical protein